MEKLIITTIQTNLHWENKTANLEMLEKKVLGIAEKTNVVLLPEMFSTGFSMNPKRVAEPMDGKTINWLKVQAKNAEAIVTGSFISIENGTCQEGNFIRRNY